MKMKKVPVARVARPEAIKLVLLVLEVRRFDWAEAFVQFAGRRVEGFGEVLDSIGAATRTPAMGLKGYDLVDIVNPNSQAPETGFGMFGQVAQNGDFFRSLLCLPFVAVQLGADPYRLVRGTRRSAFSEKGWDCYARGQQTR